MPDLDGFQATIAIRALPDPAKARLPIIAMTAHAMKGDRDRCLAGGMDGYLAKPIRSREMFALIAQLLQKNGPSSENSDSDRGLTVS
jgi:CheY-like chemotaxis protein